MSATPQVHDISARRRPAMLALLGAILFVAFYFSVDIVQAVVAIGSLPLPGAPSGEVYDYFVANRPATALISVAQLLSVAGLAMFIGYARRTLGPSSEPRSTWGNTAGLAAVAAMVVSVGLSLVLSFAVSDMSVGAVAAFRQASFIAGGVAHVVLLGTYVGLTGREHPNRGMRVFGIVAMVPALVSLISLVWFYGNAFILLGRLLCMAWTIAAGITLVRAARRARVAEGLT
jgi:hypothetical protein